MEISNWIGHKKRGVLGDYREDVTDSRGSGVVYLQDEPTPLFRPSASS